MSLSNATSTSGDPLVHTRSSPLKDAVAAGRADATIAALAVAPFKNVRRLTACGAVVMAFAS